MYRTVYEAWITDTTQMQYNMNVCKDIIQPSYVNTNL